MNNTERSEARSYLPHDDRGRQLKAGMSEALGLAQKLQALTDENVYLERHLAVMVQGNRLLQSIRARKPCFKV
jgi:hypothetical protein